MSRAWQLPEHIADVLPAEAARIEALRRRLLDGASRSGFELVVPPMLEHLESLMSASGGQLELQTFKLVDQLSGRSLGVRADITPQAARIDAHLLNREGVTRLCYCGPVLHTRASGVAPYRELLQFGAEIFGHAGLEADLEIQELCLDLLREVGLRDCTLDLADARLLPALLEPVTVAPAVRADIMAALGRKDAPAVAALSQHLPGGVKEALASLLRLYGGCEVLAAARELLPSTASIVRALDDLAWLAGHLQAREPGLRLGFDLSDMGGWGYYSAARCCVYCPGSHDAVARGGRYDEVGAAFGRNRPAAGFSLDVRTLAALLEDVVTAPAIRAPWTDDVHLRAAVRRLRDAGETVVFDFPGAAAQECGRSFDRELVQVTGQWLVRALA